MKLQAIQVKQGDVASSLEATHGLSNLASHQCNEVRNIYVIHCSFCRIAKVKSGLTKVHSAARP
jgi:hypothetical protein